MTSHSSVLQTSSGCFLKRKTEERLPAIAQGTSRACCKLSSNKNTLAPLVGRGDYSKTNSSRALRQACPEDANRPLRQAQGERLAYRRAQGRTEYYCS